MKLREAAIGTALSRKDEVIRVAARLFAAKGYYATTLDEIAEKMGVTKPALYYYVANKEDILRTIIGMMVERMEDVTAIGNSKLNPRERIRNIIRTLVKYAAEGKEITQIAFEQSSILPKRSREALKRRQKKLELLGQAFDVWLTIWLAQKGGRGRPLVVLDLFAGTGKSYGADGDEIDGSSTVMLDRISQQGSDGHSLFAGE